MDPITAGLVLGGLSFGSNLMSNSAIASTASANASANAERLAQNYAVQTNQLQDMGREIQKQAGMQLTDLLYKSLKAQGTQIARTASTGVYGATAARQVGNIQVRQALSADQIMADADAKMLDVNNKLRNAKYSYESGQMSNAIDFSNAMSQQKTGIQMFAEAGSTGLNTFAMLKPL